MLPGLTRPADPTHRAAVRWPLTLLADVVCVLAFVLIGRANHSEGETVAGTLRVLWPFAVGLSLGWALARVVRLPLASWRVGLVVTGSTVVVGMALRALSGQGVAVDFIVVATLFLALFLVGWRLLLGPVRRCAQSR